MVAQHGAAAVPGKKARPSTGGALRRLAGTQAGSVLEAVARRLEEDPAHVLPTLVALADPDMAPSPFDENAQDRIRTLNAARLAARMRGFRAHAFPTSQVRELLGGVSRQAVSQRVANGTLLAAEVGGTLYFPDWQFGPDGPRRGLPHVLAVLAESASGPVAADAVMRAPLPEEGGRSAADLLAEGAVEKAAHYAGIAGGGL
jgi:hypothetical protein